MELQVLPILALVFTLTAMIAMLIKQDWFVALGFLGAALLACIAVF